MSVQNTNRLEHIALSSMTERNAESQLSAPLPCTPSLVTTLPALRRLANRLMEAPAIAVDTESDSLYSYTEKVCLVQISLPDQDFIIDPLVIGTLEPLADVFASYDVLKIFHGADYDIVSLKRSYQFEVNHIFDTMLACRVLGKKNFGLAALLAEYLGLSLDKRMQRSDWGARPLSPAQLAYACHDTRHLFDLHDILSRELVGAQRTAEAQEIFAELTTLEPRQRAFDPDTFWNLKGLRELDMAGKRAVRDLFVWRDHQARAEDRPVFKVISDRTLVALGEAKPAAFDALRASHILSPIQFGHYGRTVADIIGKALRSDERLSPPARASKGRRPDETTLAIYEALRAWRKERAAERGSEPDVIASNGVLMNLAQARPANQADLAEVGAMGPRRREQYGQEILEVIRLTLAGRNPRSGA